MEPAGYRSTGEIDPVVLGALAIKCADEHPEWSDEEAAARLAVAYPGHHPDELAAVLTAAVKTARAAPAP